MLVLSRKVGEKLVIGDQITVVVNRVSGNRVSLGIDAPPHVRIVRGELRARCGAEAAIRVERNATAAGLTAGDGHGEEEPQSPLSEAVDWPVTMLAAGVIVDRAH